MCAVAGSIFLGPLLLLPVSAGAAPLSGQCIARVLISLLFHHNWRIGRCLLYLSLPSCPALVRLHAQASLLARLCATAQAVSPPCNIAITLETAHLRRVYSLALAPDSWNVRSCTSLLMSPSSSDILHYLPPSTSTDTCFPDPSIVSLPAAVVSALLPS